MENVLCLGVNAATIELIAATPPTITITFDGTTFTERTKNKLQDVTMTCNIGEEFVHDLGVLGGLKSVSYCNISDLCYVSYFIIITITFVTMLKCHLNHS